MLSPLLFLLAQSATPYGSPVDPLLRPSEVRPAVPAQAEPSAPSTDPADPAEIRFNACVNEAIDDPENGVFAANRWQIEGGGYLARHCLGFAYAEQQDWPKATKAFATAAQEAESAGDERAANLWAQAGNAALANGDYADAQNHLARALRQEKLGGLLKGEVHLDLARVYVANNQYEEAKREFAQVHTLVPQDPLGWLLSATLARRMADLTLAKADIIAAEKLAPGDPAVALEAGNIAYAAGDTANAQKFWKQAVAQDSESEPARAAKKYLAQLEQGPPTPETP
ncbi:tetratricopeptide repeat protein [Parasphingorhabdus halotolerans]|uniref:Tetratricopeptide repeat protein n=1 Tax=Parasphingorhabdus halotolerans TaxID=2725558 RepID=A0A6H2DJP5_9SPHN|nr:tetratricopeptide repeat protein [Parasphingorhabdus halotolerans]QJB68899.1 tetratricopeptide repeat protein [Parasphingorhabdus halotolerans]